MERVTAVFLFTEKYDHTNFTKQDATVRLEVDYRSKTFSIFPYTGEKSFSFIQTSHNYKMWNAILKAIESAIEFANYEVGVSQRTEQAR